MLRLRETGQLRDVHETIACGKEQFFDGSDVGIYHSDDLDVIAD
jgi:hypothetical protein